MGRIRDFLVVLALLALLMGARSSEDAEAQGDADPLQIARPQIRLREPTRAFLKISIDRFCPHGFCGHFTPLLAIKLDGREEPPFVTLTTYVDGRPHQTTSRSLTRARFESLIKGPQSLRLEGIDPQLNRYESISVESSLIDPRRRDVPASEHPRVVRSIADLVRQEPLIQELEQELDLPTVRKSQTCGMR